MNFRYLLIAFLVALLGACGSPEQASDTAEVTEAEEQTAEAMTEETAEELEEIAVEEESAEAEPEEVSDEIVLAKPAASKPRRTDWKYSEGDYFRRMTTSQGTSSAPDKIEVAEIFWYGCPHCYDFDPILKDWQTSLADDVAFVKIPVIWNPTNQQHARIMYTAEALGKLDEMHPAIFAAIHQQGKALMKDEEIVELFAAHDVSEQQYRETFNSFGVSSQVKRAENLTRRYGIRSVPVMVVNGKYATDGTQIKTFDDVLGVTNELIEREREEL